MNTGVTLKQRMINDAIAFQRNMMQLYAAQKEWKAIARIDYERCVRNQKEQGRLDEDGFPEDSYARRDRGWALSRIYNVSSERSKEAENIRNAKAEKFVKHLIFAYPKDGKRIQKIVMDCGWETKEEVRYLFIKAVGRHGCLIISY